MAFFFHADWSMIHGGVSQGTVLGALLFFIGIDDPFLDHA